MPMTTPTNIARTYPKFPEDAPTASVPFFYAAALHNKQDSTTIRQSNGGIKTFGRDQSYGNAITVWVEELVTLLQGAEVAEFIEFYNARIKRVGFFNYIPLQLGGVMVGRIVSELNVVPSPTSVTGLTQVSCTIELISVDDYQKITGSE